MSWTWQPQPSDSNPLDTPFAWALIRLDGADTPLLHAVAANGPDEISTGARVDVVWAGEPRGAISDIAHFVLAADDGPVEIPEAAADVEVTITAVREAISVIYDYSAGPGFTSFLDAIAEGRLVGRRCPSCELVDFPPRQGVCPREGVMLGEDVEVGPLGTVTTFCIVNVPFLGQQIEIPYVAASIQLDGADIAFQHLIQECDASEVRTGMRVEPVWKDRCRVGAQPDQHRPLPARPRIERAMTARRVAIVASAQAAGSTGTNLTPVELLTPIVHGALAAAGLDRKDVGFWCHGSCDYMSGQPFSFVSAVDALGAWPPIVESHVEADGAFALYEAWLKLLTGDCDTALVFANGKSSSGPIADVMALQLDPYTVAPLRPDMHAIAGLAARACLDAGVVDERSMAEVAARSLGDAGSNPTMVRAETVTADELLSWPVYVCPASRRMTARRSPTVPAPWSSRSTTWPAR